MKLETEREVAEERGRQGQVCVPADAMLTASLSGEEGSNLSGLPPLPADFAGDAPNCWLMLLCRCWRKSHRSVSVTPPPLPEPSAGGLDAMGTGRVGVLYPLPPTDGSSLTGTDGVILEPLGENS